MPVAYPVLFSEYSVDCDR